MEMRLQQVPQAKNHQVDELARLTSSLGEWITQEIVAQMELLPYLEANPSPKV